MAHRQDSRRQRLALPRALPRTQFSSGLEDIASRDQKHQRRMGESEGISRRRSEWSLRREGVVKRRSSCYMLLRPGGENEGGAGMANKDTCRELALLEKRMQGLGVGRQAVDRERLVRAFKLLRKRLRDDGLDVAEVRVVAEEGKDEDEAGNGGAGTEGGSVTAAEEVLEVGDAVSLNGL
eukprot:GFKZ01009201.1.p1 GENE.GFKZ01009201.1~~GFKZ01009201.1.p1  ORF type:complete len:180 (+),score=27.18 GFKZ01009201.1:200-739(+)